MLESKYTRRLTVKDLLALGVIFESQAARFYSLIGKLFYKDVVLNTKMMAFAQEDWANRKHYKEMISHLKANECVFVDESDYQHMRQMLPENFIPMNIDHPERMLPQNALRGMIQFEKSFINFKEDLLTNPKGYNQPMAYTPEVMEMLNCESKHLKEVEKFFHEHYAMA